MNTHILENFIVEPRKIFQITSAVAGAMFGVGDGAIEVQFGFGDTNNRSTNILISIEAIATNRHAHAMRFCFACLETHGAYKVSASNFSSSRSLAWWNKENNLVASELTLRWTIDGETLSAASPFVG